MNDLEKKSIECIKNMPIEETTYQVARNVVLDLITNLQQENEELKEYLKIMEKGKDNNLNRFLNYKSHYEKAVKYIKENAWYMNKDDEEILDRIGIEGLLKILEGDNNE